MSRWAPPAQPPLPICCFADSPVSAFPAHVAAQQRAEDARQTEDAARAALEREIRPVTNFVQGYTKTTDADRATIGITVRDTSRTPSPTPTTRPLVSVDPGTRLTHTLRLVDSGEGSTTGGRRGRGGKPEGVAGAEVWVKLVDAGSPAGSPVSASLGDPATFSFLTLTSRPTVRTEFKSIDGGKTAVYMLRWVNPPRRTAKRGRGRRLVQRRWRRSDDRRGALAQSCCTPPSPREI